MFTLIIRERAGDERREFFDEQEILVGRIPGNDLVLRAGNVSRQHARFMFRDGRLIVADLGSANGTYVNGRKIRHATILRDSDEVWIGDFYLRVEMSVRGPAPVKDSNLPPGAKPPAQWFVYRDGGQTVGPVSSDQVAGGIRAGKVPLDSYVCPAEGGEWKLVDQVIDFVGAVRSITDALASRERQGHRAPTEIPSHLATDAGPEALWYVSANGSAPFGPITTEQVRRGIRSGQVAAVSQVNRAGSPDWYDLVSLPEFYDEVLRATR